MKYIFNTDLFTMKGRYADEKQLRKQVSLRDAMKSTTTDKDVVYGDPTQFDRDDPYNTFDQGWDLDGDADAFFQGMK